MTDLSKKLPIELLLGLFKDKEIAAQYRREIEKRIKKRSFEVSLEDMAEFLNPLPQAQVISHLKAKTEPINLLINLLNEDGSFRPLPREDFSKVGAWRIAEAILNTEWEGCYTKTQDPHDSLVTLKRIWDKKLVGEDDFDSHAHANLFRVIVGKFNKWASERLLVERTR